MTEYERPAAQQNFYLLTEKTTPEIQARRNAKAICLLMDELCRRGQLSEQAIAAILREALH